MFNMDQIAVMDRNSLIGFLDDAEKCLVTVQKELDQRSFLEQKKTELQAKCEEIQKKIKAFPFIPGIVASVVLTMLSRNFAFLLVGIIIAAVLYKKFRYPVFEEQIQDIQTQQLPSIELQIENCGNNLMSLTQSALNVKSLLSLLPENFRNVESICGIKKELNRGARDWYSALQGYEAVLARQEQERQMRKMQENVQQVATNSERTATAVDDVRKHTEDIARNTERTAAASERTAAAAESTAQNTARTAAAAESSAASNARTARAAESAAYWIYTSL